MTPSRFSNASGCLTRAARFRRRWVQTLSVALCVVHREKRENDPRRLVSGRLAEKDVDREDGQFWAKIDVGLNSFGNFRPD